jgi:hypothetical protein
MSSVGGVWDAVVGTQAQPSDWLVLGVGVVAVAAVGTRSVWHLTRNVVTIAHEGGHAVAALATGRKLQGIRLHSDTSGVTVSRGKPHGPGMVITAMAGYIAPSLVGLTAAALLATGHISAVLWAAVVLLVAILLLIRNAYGALAVLVTGGVIFVVSWYASTTAQAALAYGVTWFFLLAGIRPVVELQSKRVRGRAGDSDADQLARLTGVPALGWVSLFGLVALASLGIGIAMLLPALPHF